MGEIAILFGGGRNTRSRTSDIDAQECAEGENFDLSLSDSGFTRRKAFDTIGTAPGDETYLLESSGTYLLENGDVLLLE